jgi:Ca2+-binding EF-hand superfamily protein
LLVLPGAFRLQLDISVNGKPPAAWDAFLGRLFDYFDRDGDGALSRDEASRLMPLPLPGGKRLTIDFARLDTNGDGKASRAELSAYCRANGFRPAVVVVAPPSADDLRLSELLRGSLDANGDGKFTQAGLRQAPAALRKFDLNEDEFLELAELLASAPPAGKAGAAQVEIAVASVTSAEQATLRLDLGAKPRAPSIDGKVIQLVPADHASGRHRLYGPDGRWTMSLRTSRTDPDLASAGAFLAAQFKDALGDRPALSKAELEQDASTSGLVELFRYADRNGDDRLTLAELEDYLRLVELGMQAQIWVRVADHAGNACPFLDSDGDGRLSYRELTRAAELLPPGATEMAGLPRQLELSCGGPAVRSWGGVPIPAVAKRPLPASPAVPAPRWFQAMDRNGDGVISPSEFIGPPEVFRRLDRNGDGVITPEEAR